MNGFIIILIFLIVAILAKRITKSWINPAFLMIIYWATLITLALITFDNFEWNYIGLLWIIISCVLFGIGYILGSSFIHNKSTNNKEIANKTKQLTSISWSALWIIIIIGFSRTVLEVLSNGFSLEMLFNLDTLITINTDLAFQRYYGGSSTNNIIMQIMLIFVYAGPLCGGYALNHIKKKSHYILCFLTFLPSVSSLLITNGKAGVIASVFLWCSGYLVGHIAKNKKGPNVELNKVIKFGVIGLLFLGLLFLSMLFRIGDFSKETRVIVSEKFEVYALGNVPAFDFWFKNHEDNSSYNIGEYTFIGLYDALGIANQKQGIFNEVVYVTERWPTNVYTVFRGLISDFGIFGSWVFIASSGLLAGMLYTLLIINRDKKNIMLKVFLSMMYFFIFYSFIVSSFSYLSYILAFFIFAIYLWLSDQNHSKEEY